MSKAKKQIFYDLKPSKKSFISYKSKKKMNLKKLHIAVRKKMSFRFLDIKFIFYRFEEIKI